MTQTECPYCHHFQEEPDECYTEDELCEVECEGCGKIYGVRPYYVRGYYEYPMDCANGSPHEYEKLHTSREGNWERCKWCEKEREVTEEAEPGSSKKS